MEKAAFQFGGFQAVAGEIWQVERFPFAPVGLPLLGDTPSMQALLIADKQTSEAFEPDVTETEKANTRWILKRLCKAAKTAGNQRPERLEVRDPELAEALRKELEPLGIQVDRVESLDVADGIRDQMMQLMGQVFDNPAMMNQIMDQALEGADLSGLPEPLQSVKGMTPDRWRAFAEAACLFIAAEPWRELLDEDLLKIDRPKPPAKGLGYASVLGAAGQQRGIGFFPSEKAYHHMIDDSEQGFLPDLQSGLYSFLLNAPQESFPQDVAFWKKNNLPLCGEDQMLPTFLLYKEDGAAHPSAKAFAWLEGLCRALADTTPQEMDAGSWEKQVTTFEGPALYKLSLPFLLEADKKPSTRPADPRAMMDQMHRQMGRLIRNSGLEDPDEINRYLQENIMGKKLDAFAVAPTTPIEQAEDLSDQAAQATGRQQLQLARRALEMDPDCAAAYVVLAERTGDASGRLELYKKAVGAGERRLREAGAFDDPEYPFWGAIESRPYLRARMGAAETLENMGRSDEAIEEYKTILELNPNDNQGARYLLAPLLLRSGRLDEAEKLLSQYAGEDSTQWRFAAALLAYRRGDKSAPTKLHEAARTNAYAIRYLLGREEMPPVLPQTYEYGSRQEAILLAAEQKDAWQSVPQAMAGLRQYLRTSRPAKKKKKRR